MFSPRTPSGAVPTEPRKLCPRCGRPAPLSSEHCACGHQFRTRCSHVGENGAPRSDRRLPIFIGGLVVLGIGGLLAGPLKQFPVGPSVLGAVPVQFPEQAGPAVTASSAPPGMRTPSGSVTSATAAPSEPAVPTMVISPWREKQSLREPPELAIENRCRFPIWLTITASGGVRREWAIPPHERATHSLPAGEYDYRIDGSSDTLEADTRELERALDLASGVEGEPRPNRYSAPGGMRRPSASETPSMEGKLRCQHFRRYEAVFVERKWSGTVHVDLGDHE